MLQKNDDICVNAFKVSLLLVNWEPITNEEDVNVAYAYFVDTCVSLNNKNCPLKETCIDDNNSPVKPWLTKGLRNAFKKKIFLKMFGKTEQKVQKTNIKHTKIN